LYRWRSLFATESSRHSTPARFPAFPDITTPPSRAGLKPRQSRQWWVLKARGRFPADLKLPVDARRIGGLRVMLPFERISEKAIFA